MKKSTKKMLRAITLLFGFTLVGYMLSAAIVYWLLTKHAAAWIINNTVFLFTFIGFIVGAIAFINVINTEYLKAYHEEVIAEEKLKDETPTN